VISGWLVTSDFDFRLLPENHLLCPNIFSGKYFDFILPGCCFHPPSMLSGTKKNVPTSMRPRWKQDESTMKQAQDESHF